jgi:spore maturation protein CgeB
MKKILRICPAPNHYNKIRNFYNLDSKSFNFQRDIYMKENMLLPGNLSTYIDKFGDFSSLDVLYPDNSYICKWLEENTGQIILTEDIKQNFLKLITVYKPDIIFIYAGANFWVDRNFRDEIRNIAQNKLIFIALWGDELNLKLYNYNSYFSDLDFVFTTSTKYSKKFDEISVPNKVIGNCFDQNKELIDKIALENKKDIDVLFCGTTGYLVPEHLNRYKLLELLCKNCNVKIFTDDTYRLELDTLRKKNISSIYKFPIFFLKFAKILFKFYYPLEVINYVISEKKKNISEEIILAKETSQHPDLNVFNNKFPLSKIFKKKFNKPKLFQHEYLNLLKRSKIVINIHRDEDCDIGNVRCYEATGVGSLLITDRGEDLEYFFRKKDFISFLDFNDLIKKINYYLSHDKEREEIAKNGNETCLKFHTSKNRAAEIAGALNGLFNVQ